MAERNAEKDGRTDATECPNSSKSNTTTKDSNPNLGTNQDDSAMLANSKAVLRSKQSLKKFHSQSAIGTVEVAFAIN